MKAIRAIAFLAVIAAAFTELCPAAVHAQGSQKADSPDNEHEGGADMFWRSRSTGAVDSETGHNRRDAGEIFALIWGRLTATYADIRQRVYRRKIDTPKTDNSTSQAALSEGLLAGNRKLAHDGG